MDFYFKDNVPYIKVKIHGKKLMELEALIDSGGAFSGFPVKICNELGLETRGVIENIRGICTGEEGVTLPVFSCKIEVLDRFFDTCIVGLPDWLLPIFGRDLSRNFEIDLDWKKREIRVKDPPTIDVLKKEMA